MSPVMSSAASFKMPQQDCRTGAQDRLKVAEIYGHRRGNASAHLRPIIGHPSTSASRRPAGLCPGCQGHQNPPSWFTRWKEKGANSPPNLCIEASWLYLASEMNIQSTLHVLAGFFATRAASAAPRFGRLEQSNSETSVLPQDWQRWFIKRIMISFLSVCCCSQAASSMS